jgi:hypothetical protein
MLLFRIIIIMPERRKITEKMITVFLISPSIQTIKNPIPIIISDAGRTRWEGSSISNLLMMKSMIPIKNITVEVNKINGLFLPKELKV